MTGRLCLPPARPRPHDIRPCAWPVTEQNPASWAQVGEYGDKWDLMSYGNVSAWGMGPGDAAQQRRRRRRRPVRRRRCHRRPVCRHLPRRFRH